MTLMRRKLDIPEKKWVTTICNHGNTIASSIPIAPYEAIKQKRLCRVDYFMLLGTGAGLSLAALVLEY